MMIKALLFRFPARLMILITCCLMAAGAVYATDTEENENAGSIRGRVLSADGNPAPGIPVLLKDSKKTAWTDESGAFVMHNVAPGNRVVIVSLPGYEVVMENVTVERQKTAQVTITLRVSQKQLQEVVITGGGNKFARRETDYVARLPLRNLENPQVYNVIGKELLKEQVVTNFDDALKNAPGVNKLWSATGRAGDGAGYYSIRGFAVQPKVVNGVAGASNGSPDPANIERIEVIKGPSGTLFGSSLVSFGGLINVVTKQPYKGFGAEVAYTGGSYGLNRVTADVNTPLDSAGRALLRVNAAYHHENSWQDAGFRKSYFFAPSLSYQVNDRLSFRVNTEFFQSQATNGVSLFLVRGAKLPVTRPQDMGIDFSRSFTSNDIVMKNPVVNVNAQVNYKLSDKWVLQTNISTSNRQSNGYYSYLNLYSRDSLSRIISDQQSSSIFTDIQQNLVGEFNIGSLRNRLVVGIDFLSSTTNNNNSAYFTFDNISVGNKEPNYNALNRHAVDAMAARAGRTRNRALTNTYSAYASDVINITDNLMAMLSLRIDRFDNRGTKDFGKDTTTGIYAQTAFSPKLGLVYEVVKDRLSVFANYMNGFQNVQPLTIGNETFVFKPQQANQFEAGVKAELLSGKLTASASYYDIYVKDVTRPDPNRAGYTVQDGNISSRGFEADIIANPLPGLNIVAGYGYNDSKNEKTNVKVDNGLRPTGAGPAHLANAWISYRLESGALKGLGLGFGGNYASENIVTNSIPTGQFILPSYTVLNASLFFERPSFRVGLKLDNLANKQYWSGWTTVEPQMPRRFAASLALRF